MKTVNGQAQLTIAFIAIGAAKAAHSLNKKQHETVMAQYNGMIDLVCHATDYWGMIEKLYNGLNEMERELFGCWDYEVSEPFGTNFVLMLADDKKYAPIAVLRDTVDLRITKERFNNIFFSKGAQNGT